MGRRVLRRHIWGYSVCLCPIKGTPGLNKLKAVNTFPRLVKQNYLSFAEIQNKILLETVHLTTEMQICSEAMVQELKVCSLLTRHAL